MISYEQLLEYKSQALTGRDVSRLIQFVKAEDLEKLGISLKEGAVWETLDLTHENVLAQLEKDLDFAFEKALDKRGISASEMYAVIKMWLFVLEDELKDFEYYAQYGLPLFKQVAVKFGFENQIGEDEGDEDEYAG